MSSSSLIFIECPHCKQLIEIVKTNCCIFRCGIYKTNYTQINPHMHKEACLELAKQSKIYGCGKPFRIEKTTADNDSFTAVVCDYI